jgi:hypothetical protein
LGARTPEDGHLAPFGLSAYRVCSCLDRGGIAKIAAAQRTQFLVKLVE